MPEMGSSKVSEVVGEFMHPVIGPDCENDDPWLRNYNQPPMFDKILVPRSFSLIDARPLLENPEYTPTGLLKSHGFGIVKHRSALFDQPDLEGDALKQAIIDIYEPEIVELVKKTTGAKTAFATVSIVRRGKAAPEPYKLPVTLAIKSGSANSKQSKETTKGSEIPEDKSDQKLVAMAAPVRVPHLDQTPLGMRQFTRFSSQAIYDAAQACGAIAAENKICEGHSCKASDIESDPFIAEQYNQNGKLGPRYAAYSIWRPLKRVARDPLTVAPRKEVSEEKGDMVYWRYENKSKGKLGYRDGDYLKEFGMLGVKTEKQPVDESDPLKWYYLSQQKNDEVYFIQLFDSASLGADSEHAGAPWHGSPEIGNIFGDDARESIDVRVQVFW